MGFVPPESDAAAASESCAPRSPDEATRKSEKCGICLDIVIDRGVLDCCNDWFCFTCIDNWATITNLCPLCKSEFQLITCMPVYDSFGNLMDDSQLCSSSRDGDDWIIQERNNALSFPSYYISEDAVQCLEADGCKIRSGQPLSTEEDSILETSIACDSCDVWYHAFCVEFDPQNQLGNSWLCPRCITDEIPQKRFQSSGEIVQSVPYTFSSNVSISVADEGETALVVSMIDDQRSMENISSIEMVQQMEATIMSNSESTSASDADAGKNSPLVIDDINVQLSHDSIMPFAEAKSSNLVKEILVRSDALALEIPSEPISEVKALGSSSASLSETISVPMELVSFDPDHQLSSDKASETAKPVAPDTSAASPISDEMLADLAFRSDGDICGREITDSEPTLKNETSACTKKDENIKRTRDQGSGMAHEKNFKKTKLDSLSAIKQFTSTTDSQKHIKIRSVYNRDEMPCSSETDIVTPEMVNIVREVRKKPTTIAANKSSTNKITKSDATTGLRVKKIMHRAGEGAELTDLLHNLTKQIRDAISASSSKSFAGNDDLDNKLLAAFRASILRSQTIVSTKSNPSTSRFSKSLQRGKVRENLKKKIYKTNGRLRRAWNRDCEIEFWKHRCLNNKPKKVEALQSVLNYLKGITPSPGEFGYKQMPSRNAENSILSRVYLADASLLPRTEDIKPLSDFVTSSSVPVIDHSKECHLGNSLGNGSNIVCGTTSQETTSASKQVTLNAESKEVNKSSVCNNKKECRNKLQTGVLTSGPAQSSKKGLEPMAMEDKRKWALQILAKKNAADKGKDQEKQEDSVMLNGNFPLLAQLPMDMRPAVTPDCPSKIPLSVRQAQLYRLTEFYLRRANVPVINKTAATELAVADAINIEKGIFQKSKSKLVYMNLCSQHINLHPQKNKILDVEQVTVSHEDVQPLNENTGIDISGSSDSEITEVLKQTGLFSDSPPQSPCEPIKNPHSNDLSEANTDDEDFDDVLDIGHNTDIDIYRDFEYDLDDEAYSISKTLYNVVSNVQSDRLKMKVVLSTLDTGKHNEFLEEVTTCGEQQTNNSDTISPKVNVPLLEKGEFTQSSSPKVDVDGSCFSKELADNEKHEEPSLTECEELYGPMKNLEGGLWGNELASATDIVLYQTESDKLKNEAETDELKNKFVVAHCKNTEIFGIKMTREEAPSSYSPSNEILCGTEKLTSNNREPSRDTVSQKVEAYVKEHIRPLFKSGIITAEQYKWTVGKTRDKVMKYHYKAKNANFLIKEGDKVKKLAQQYVEAASKQQDLKK